jgi:hypothetical protein
VRLYRFPPPGTRLRKYDLGVILWPSFLAACAASLLFFAAVDPLLLRDAGPQMLSAINRESGYAIGFAFFWGVAALASALSVYLIRTARGDDKRPDRLL